MSHQEMETELMQTVNFLTYELQLRVKGSNNYLFLKNRQKNPSFL